MSLESQRFMKRKIKIFPRLMTSSWPKYIIYGNYIQPKPRSQQSIFMPWVVLEPCMYALKSISFVNCNVFGIKTCEKYEPLSVIISLIKLDN